MNLATFYQQIFSMVQHHKYSISEIENLYPYERDIYFELLISFLQEQQNEGHSGSIG